METFEILSGITVVILVLYYYFAWTFNFWKLHGVRGPPPIPVFGNCKDIMTAKVTLSDFVTKLYYDFKDERMIGIFVRGTPTLIVKDPDLIKDILIKDFATFADRGFTTHEKADPLSQHLFGLEHKRWRPLRTSLSPVFTSGKLKGMFSMMSDCADRLERYIDKAVSKNDFLECTEVMTKYATDVIGTCVFGIEMNALSNEDSEFHKMGSELFNSSWRTFIEVRLREFAPKLFNIIYSILPYSEVTKFFMRIIKETMDYREMHNIVRNDYIDMLRELKKNPKKVGDIELTDTLIAAQAFVFFFAGFGTSSTTISNALYELAQRQEIQNKLREEIADAYAKHGSDLTYNDVKKMDYLKKVFNETLRMYPLTSSLLRQSTSCYTFNGTKVSIPKGQMVWIPIHAIHRDQDIYPEPMTFDPERFNEEVGKTRHPMCYLPFGNGPRKCIADRFAIFQIKIGLIKILRKYKVETCEKTQIPYVGDPKAFFFLPKGGICLRIRKIDQA